MARHEPTEDIGNRKKRHLEICTDKEMFDVENGSTMMDDVQLIHKSLPELNADDVDMSSEFLGFPVSLPCFISSMTGGSSEAFKANKDLARVAQEARIPVGTGSIRILFTEPDVMNHFQLKEFAPDVPVFANIGGVQLRERDNSKLVELIRRLEVDAVAVHLNPGQELSQPEGDRDFRGVLSGIARLCDKCSVPVIVKETGFGIGPDEVRPLIAAGARYVDVAGSGGTNWMTVEGYRLSEHEQQVTNEFAGWGIPTAALLAASRRFEGKILASGGLRTGMDVVKSIVLGAVSAGLALPFIRAIAESGVDGGLELVDRIRTVVQNAMVLTGSRTVADLRSAPYVTSLKLDRFVTALNRQAGV
jgi:isopentenyl-diphosphate Delta-isomerase